MNNLENRTIVVLFVIFLIAVACEFGLMITTKGHISADSNEINTIVYDRVTETSN